MGEVLNNLYNSIMTIINSSAFYGPLFACLLIFFESLLPVMPLFIFFTIIFVAYGYVLGFIVSYVLTTLGCFVSFYICRKYLKKVFEKKVRKNKRFDKMMQKMDKFNINYLVILISIPFTPAFLVNIAAALSNMSFKKFFIGVMIGKVVLVSFWGFIGTSLLESLRNPLIMIIIILMLTVAFIISKIVSKKLDIE